MNTYQTLPVIIPPNKFGTTRSIFLTNGGLTTVPTISNGTAQGFLKSLPSQQAEIKSQPLSSTWNSIQPTSNAQEGCTVYVSNSAKPASKSVVRGRSWSWCSTIWAVFATMFCASFCGFIGLLCAVHAYVDHKTGDTMGSRYKTKCSWCFSLVGIFIGLSAIISVIVLMVEYGYRIDMDGNITWDD